MARSTDPRASGFNAAAFKDAVKFAMKMGAPDSEALRATFIWRSVSTYAAADSGGQPWSLSDTPLTTTETDPVLVDVAVEFVARTTLAGGTPIGNFDTPRAIITILDDDYALITGADQVLLGGNTYNIDLVAPPLGLFGVTIYQLHCSAIDEA